MLVAAFRATLEEVVEADLILHVRDISHRETEAQRHDVDTVLAGLGISAPEAAERVVEVWNKADRLDTPQREEVEHARTRAEHQPVLVSAASGEGLDSLQRRIDMQLGTKDEILSLEIPAQNGRLLGWLHANAEVLEADVAETGTVTARFRIGPANRGKLAGQLKRMGLAAH
jgi:GTP-binding protein HflX